MFFFNRLMQLLENFIYNAFFLAEDKKSFATATNNQTKTEMRRESDINLDDLKKSFSLFDRNGDGSIETEELDLVMKSLGYQMSKNEVEEMINFADKDGNHKVEFDEFVSVMKNQEIFSKQQSHKLFMNDEIMHTTFKVFDRSNSGFISRYDLKRVMLDIVGEKVSDAEVDLMMLEADKDRNGKIDYEEFKMLQQIDQKILNSRKEKRK